jgi:hypothetical protein
MAAIVVVSASASACLPAVFSILGRGTPSPAVAGLGFVGVALACLKALSLLYGIRRISTTPRRSGSFQPLSAAADRDPTARVASAGD